MRRLTTLIGLMLLLTLPLMLTAQGNNLPPVNPAAVVGDITTASSGEAEPMISRLANIMSQFGYAGTITTSATDLATAFDQFCRSELDIVGASRFILDTEAQNCIGLGREPAGFTIASGALFVVTSPQNTFLNDITTDELRRAFTTANNWSDVRNGLPAEPINRYIPPQGSSALVNFANALFDGNTSQLLTALGTRALGTDALLQAIQADPNALGIVPGDAVAGSSSARVMTINGIRPDAETVSSGQYPLGFPIVLYANPAQMQTQSQIASFINFAITNAATESPAIGLYPASQAQLDTARATWFNAVRPETPPDAPQISEPAATATALALLSEIEPEDGEVIDDFPEPTPEPGPFEGDEVVVLVDARADLELLAIDQLGARRPEGWSGLLDVNNPQLPLLLRLDLELLAGSQLGVETRPVGWFGAVRSSSAAIARDIRHDLELLADTLLGIGVRPSAWAGPRDAIVRCDRSTQSLVNLLRRGDFLIVDFDASSPTFCADVAIAANRFVEQNLLTGDTGAIFNAPVNSAAPTGSIVIDTQFAVAFLDRFATLNVGVVPLGTAISPVARSYTQFSNMTLIQGEGFLVFVDWRDTTLTEDQFQQLPNFEQVNARPFCTALFCR